MQQEKLCCIIKQKVVKNNNLFLTTFDFYNIS